MKCSGFRNQPGRCDLCGGSTQGDDRAIEDLETRQRGNACAPCARRECWTAGPCCKAAP
jgi:hypothetical protein